MKQHQKDELPQPTCAILGCVLAGGQGRRMGGRDKGLIDWGGRPLVARVLDRLTPQVDEVVISANRNQATYARFGHRVIADSAHAGAGPLAGMLAVMNAQPADDYLFVPCDAPTLPLDLYARLKAALSEDSAMVACARDAERVHPIFALTSAAVQAPLSAYLAGGGRRVQAFYRSVGLVTVAWSGDGGPFENINTPDDLAHSPFLGGAPSDSSGGYS